MKSPKPDPHECEARIKVAQLADSLRRDAEKAPPASAERLIEAAATIEGHLEAFAVIVRDNHGLKDELRRFQILLRGAYDIIADYAQGKC
jgi:hypothetical protein